MKLTILIIPEAEAEIKEAYQWYEKRSECLGNDFLLCMEEALTKILRNPGVHPVVHREIHRALIRRFPYGVFYQMKEDKIIVLAVFHARRDPKRWKSRI